MNYFSLTEDAQNIKLLFFIPYCEFSWYLKTLLQLLYRPMLQQEAWKHLGLLLYSHFFSFVAVTYTVHCTLCGLHISNLDSLFLKLRIWSRKLVSILDNWESLKTLGVKQNLLVKQIQCQHKTKKIVVLQNKQ